MKKIKKVFSILVGFIGLGLSVRVLSLAYKNPSFENIFGALTFALIGTFLILDGIGLMQKIDKIQIRIGK
jgi:hypothetical protein